MRAVVRRALDGPARSALVLVGLFSFYVDLRRVPELQGLPARSCAPSRHDTGLLTLDRDLFFGHDPATLLHDLLGTGIANQVLSVVYVIYLAFVPMSLAAALVWFGDDPARALVRDRAVPELGARAPISYYLIPSMGPGVRRAAAVLRPRARPRRRRCSTRCGSSGSPSCSVRPASRPRDVVQSIAAFASLHVSVVLTAALVATLLKAQPLAASSRCGRTSCWSWSRRSTSAGTTSSTTSPAR